MQSKDTRVFTVDGKQVRFDAQIFNKNFESCRRSKKIGVGEFEEQLAKKLNVSREAVHNWRFRKNGPSDVEMLIKIAKTLGLSDWTLLTKEIDGGNTMTQLTERQKNAAKRIYDVCIWFLSEFSNTDGFNDYWYKFKDAGSTDPEEDIYELVQEKMDKVGMVLDRSISTCTVTRFMMSSASLPARNCQTPITGNSAMPIDSRLSRTVIPPRARITTVP